MHRLQCGCGALQGCVLPGAPQSRVVCYCSDCQAFAHYLGAGHEVLDSQGGTAIVQLCQSRLRFAQGIEHLASLRLAERGLIRWYARCCSTPIGNTMSDPKMGFVGLIHSCLDHAALDRDFGTSVALVNTGSARGVPKPRTRGLLRAMLVFVRLMASSRLQGRYRDSPLFTVAGQPIASPQVLTEAELQALKQRVTS